MEVNKEARPREDTNSMKKMKKVKRAKKYYRILN